MIQFVSIGLGNYSEIYYLTVFEKSTNENSMYDLISDCLKGMAYIQSNSLKMYIIVFVPSALIMEFINCCWIIWHEGENKYIFCFQTEKQFQKLINLVMSNGELFIKHFENNSLWSDIFF